MVSPTTRSVLLTLSKPRLLELGQALAIAVPPSGNKEQQADALASATTLRFRELLASLGWDELKIACRAHGLDDASRARPQLAARLLQAHGAAESAPPPPIFVAHQAPRYAPRPGDIVAVRHRQWLVEGVVAPPVKGNSTLVRLVCLDDDNRGRPLEVLWELELGARVLHPEAHGLGDVARIDPPRHFAAYLHAFKWSAVTATDAKLFQAPFRAVLLRETLDVGLELAGAPCLKAALVPDADTWIVPELPESWQPTLDTLRPPRRRDKPFWEFRKRPPQPIVFRPPLRMNSALSHLHLQHPFVQRGLGRFLSQGYSAHDLSRVTVVRTRHDSLGRVIAFGRLSLFGSSATRLHDQLVSVGWGVVSDPVWRSDRGEGALQGPGGRPQRHPARSLDRGARENPKKGYKRAPEHDGFTLASTLVTMLQSPDADDK